MVTYAALARKARKLGHDLTPELQAELRMLADIPDVEFAQKCRKVFIKDISKRFQVTTAFAEHHLNGIGPFIQPKEPNP